MAYFSKEVYDRKRDYAYRVSREGLEIIANTLLMEEEFGTEDNYNEYIDTLADEEYEDFKEEWESKIEDLVEELEPLQELSHARHEMHSSSSLHYDIFDPFGTQWSGKSDLLLDVNDLIKKYNLGVKKPLEEPNVPEVSLDDSTEDIFDYYGYDYNLEEDDYENNWSEILDELATDWGNAQNYYSQYIREFFGRINDRFDTDFPDASTNEYYKG